MTKKISSSNPPNNLSRLILHHPFFLLLLLLFSSVSLAGAQHSNNNNNGLSPANPYDLNPNFNPSLAIIIVVLISAFFFIGFFSIYIRQCAGESSDPGGNHRQTTSRSRRGALGLDPALIETFPTFLYSYVKDLKIGKGALECAVCLSEFEDEETLRLLPICDHVFHPDCIDVWLASHTTCPVCRANLSLATESDQPQPQPQPTATATTATSTTTTTTITNSSSSDVHNSEDENRASPEIKNTEELQQVVIPISVASEDSINKSRIPAQNRAPKRGVSGKFPRSHSTGHSLVRPGENCERFTLRLPEEVRRQIVESGKLNRAKSCVSFPVGEGSVSSRRGYRGGGGGGGEGSSRGRSLQFWRTEQGARSDRWVFTMAPPFFSRASSVKSPKITDGEGSTRGNSRNFVTSVKRPFDCIGSKAAGTSQEEEATAHSPV